MARDDDPRGVGGAGEPGGVGERIELVDGDHDVGRALRVEGERTRVHILVEEVVGVVGGDGHPAVRGEVPHEVGGAPAVGLRAVRVGPDGVLAARVDGRRGRRIHIDVGVAEERQVEVVGRGGRLLGRGVPDVDADGPLLAVAGRGVGDLPVAVADHEGACLADGPAQRSGQVEGGAGVAAARVAAARVGGVAGGLGRVGGPGAIAHICGVGARTRSVGGRRLFVVGATGGKEQERGNVPVTHRRFLRAGRGCGLPITVRAGSPNPPTAHRAMRQGGANSACTGRLNRGLLHD